MPTHETPDLDLRTAHYMLPEQVMTNDETERHLLGELAAGRLFWSDLTPWWRDRLARRDRLRRAIALLLVAWHPPK